MGVRRQLSLGLRIPQQLDYCTLPHCELASLHSHVLWLVKIICKTLVILTFSRVVADRLFRLGWTGCNPVGVSSQKYLCNFRYVWLCWPFTNQVNTARSVVGHCLSISLRFMPRRIERDRWSRLQNVRPTQCTYFMYTKQYILKYNLRGRFR